MDTLIRYGFSIEEINNILNSNEAINNMEESNITDIIKILEELNCNLNQIKNIFITNPFIFTLEIIEIKKIIVKLLDLGIEDLNNLFDTNPFLLNVNFKELDSFIKKLKKNCSDQEILNTFYFESEQII